MYNQIELSIIEHIKKQNPIYWYSPYFDGKLSEKFLEEFQDKVDFAAISAYQILSENFIRKYADRVCWINISSCQKLSEKFIEEFQDEANWYRVCLHQSLSRKFIKKLSNKINFSVIPAIMLNNEHSWKVFL